MDNEVNAEIIPFYLVTGFLGSGKTTLLKNIVSGYSGEKRIAVIQNEFAPAGIDGAELKMTGASFRLVEINNGSVFCVCLMATFVESVQNIIDEYRPDMIFLEASGLSDPVNIIELLGKEGLNGRVGLANVITIVDAPNFEKGRKILPRFRHQIMIADTILINKTDIYKGNKTLLHDQIREMNPFAGIIETAWCKTDMKSFISESCGEVTADRSLSAGPSPETISGGENIIPGTLHKAAAAFSGRKPGERPDINACVVRTHQKLTPEGLRSFIKVLQESSPRIKGFMNLENGDVMAVHSVFDQCDIIRVSGYSGPSEIIAFGRDLTPRFLRDLFRKYSSRPYS